MDILCSVSGESLRSQYNHQSYPDFFNVLHEEYDGIELYTGRHDSAETDGLMAIAENELGLDVESIHAPGLEELHLENGSKELVTLINEYVLAYDDGSQREKVWSPQQITLHPSTNSVSLSNEGWGQVVDNIEDANKYLTDWNSEGLISIENCAERSPRYIFTDVDDLYGLIDAADRNGSGVNITLDVGHTTGHEYKKMVEAIVDSDEVGVSNIHVHDKVFDDAQIQGMRSDYGFEEGRELGTRENEGEVDHLPPGEGEVDFESLEPVADEDTLVTVELHPSWLERPEVLQECRVHLEETLAGEEY
jgi:sugar phosphate isomerase/epimerase